MYVYKYIISPLLFVRFIRRAYTPIAVRRYTQYDRRPTTTGTTTELEKI